MGATIQTEPRFWLISCHFFSISATIIPNPESPITQTIIRSRVLVILIFDSNISFNQRLVSVLHSKFYRVSSPIPFHVHCTPLLAAYPNRFHFGSKSCQSAMCFFGVGCIGLYKIIMESSVFCKHISSSALVLHSGIWFSFDYLYVFKSNLS